MKCVDCGRETGGAITEGGIKMSIWEDCLIPLRDCAAIPSHPDSPLSSKPADLFLN